MGFLRKKAVILIIAMITVFLLSGLIANGKYKAALWEKAIATVLFPFEYALFYVTDSFNQTLSFGSDIAKLYRDNQSLKTEIETLRLNSVNIDELLAENMRLRSLLEYKKTTVEFEFLAAKVIARDPGTWTNTITVNQGANDGVTLNMVAVNEQGLIGSVVGVYPESSKIQLIIDPRSAVGALVQRPDSRVAGIVEGNSADPFSPRMVNLAKDADVLPGDKLITSGFGGIYPKGLLVGEVVKIVNDDIGFLKYAVLTMAVDFEKLEEVLLIKNFREKQLLPTAWPGEQKEAGVQ